MKIQSAVKSKFKILVAIFCAIATVAATVSPSVAKQALVSKLELVNNANSWSLIEKEPGGKELELTSLTGATGEKALQWRGKTALVKFAGLDKKGVPLAIVATSDQAQISWTNDVEDSEIHVYVDGLELPTGGLDKAGSVNLETQPGAGLNVSALRVHLNKTKKAELASVDFTQQLVSAPLASTQTSVATALAISAQASTTKFRQTTFIPDAYLGAPSSVCTPDATKSYRFIGDNRSWSSADAASFRTRMDVTVNWLNGPSVSMAKNVGTTIRQVQTSAGAWVYDTSATATNTSMTLSVQSTSSNSAIVRLHQDVVNPLCNSALTNGIYADTLLAIYRSGAISGSINYLAMPNYELYFRQDSGPYSSLAKLALQGVHCLVKVIGGACTTATSF